MTEEILLSTFLRRFRKKSFKTPTVECVAFSELRAYCMPLGNSRLCRSCEAKIKTHEKFWRGSKSSFQFATCWTQTGGKSIKESDQQCPHRFGSSGQDLRSGQSQGVESRLVCHSPRQKQWIPWVGSRCVGQNWTTRSCQLIEVLEGLAQLAWAHARWFHRQGGYHYTCSHVPSCFPHHHKYTVSEYWKVSHSINRGIPGKKCGTIIVKAEELNNCRVSHL